MSYSPSVPPPPSPGSDGTGGTGEAPAVRHAVRPSFFRIFSGSLVVAALFASLWCYGLWSVAGLQAWTRLGLFLSGWALASCGFGWWVRRCGWATWRRAVLACLLTLATGVVPYVVGASSDAINQSSRRKAAQPRQIAAAIDQYFLESGAAIVDYDDVVGPTRYVKSVYRVDEENHRAMFPVHTFTPTLSLRLKDGFVVSYGRLDIGPAPPARFAPAEPLYPTGARPPADGVYRRVLDDGTQLEVTYRDGVPHGPFRAYDPKGRLLGEGLYDDGLPVNPRRPQTPTGPLTGVAAIREAQAFYTRGTNRFYTGDYAGAIVRFTRSIELSPNRAGAFELRGRARLMQRDVAGAVADFWRGAALRRASAPEPADWPDRRE